MNDRTNGQLEKAKELFYNWRLIEAYNIFRRYFDRLPFRPEKAHAEYIGMFARTLAELGKEHELEFYYTELQRLSEKYNQPLITYQLAVIYYYKNPRSSRNTKPLLEKLIRDPHAKEFHVKAKMLLANYYCLNGDIDNMRSVVYSIKEEIADESIALSLKIWIAIVQLYDKKYKEALETIESVFQNISYQENWYVYVSAKLTQARIYLSMGENSKARSVLGKTRALFEGRCFKTINSQMEDLQDQLRESDPEEPVKVTYDKDCWEITYAEKTISLNQASPAEILLMMLATKKFLDKESIVQHLFKRSYQSHKDDKLIYSFIHSVRKKLKALGLSSAAILNEGSGYRFVPSTIRVRYSS